MHHSAYNTQNVWKYYVRFLLIERPRTSSDELVAFDSGVLEVDVAESDVNTLLKVLDFIEDHPDDQTGYGVGFWRFITSEVLPPERRIIETGLTYNVSSRYLEVYSLDENEPIWSREQCIDQETLVHIRVEWPLFAIVPLRHGKPYLQVVGGH